MSADIRRSLDLLTAPGGVFEVRALGRWTASGYYDAAHIEKAARDIEALEADPEVKGIYVTLNEVNPSLLARRANRIKTKLDNKEATTADADIVRRRWLLVDLDPVRASGISSTDEEHDQALEMAVRVAEFLKDCFSFPVPVMGDSGNGAHLLYRIDLPNDDESKDLIVRCLKALDAAFGGQRCDIDQTVFNAARISKLYGTLTRKGDNTSERPHRRACLLWTPARSKLLHGRVWTVSLPWSSPRSHTRHPTERLEQEGRSISPHGWTSTGPPCHRFRRRRSPRGRLFTSSTCVRGIRRTGTVPRGSGNCPQAPWPPGAIITGAAAGTGTPCGILWLAGLRPPQDYWWRQLPPPGVGLFAGLLPLVTRVAQLMVAGSLTGTSH